MSCQGNLEHAPGEPAEALEIIREECSPVVSAVDMTPKDLYKGTPFYCCKGCTCVKVRKPSVDLEDVEKLLKQKEEQLTSKFNERLKKEIAMVKDRADFILQNEQVRASYMLREAHRERQEKITALQTQLECKNLAGLMYVMCTERRKSQIEKITIIEEYTNYIIALQDILTEAQSLILSLSRGYKTAARVDDEWRQKMKKTLLEFQIFVHDYMKGTPESDQYFFDWPKMLKTETPIIENPIEDPCTCEDDESDKDGAKNVEEVKPWYERMDAECRPFVVFGDMADFKPLQRREVLRAQKKIKTAPRKWKEYVFRDMYVNAECTNMDAIKKEYPSRVPPPPRWECPTAPNDIMSRLSTQFCRGGRRTTTASIDQRGGMGSILKMITSSNAPAPSHTKAMLLGARDSMEIVSTTRLREKQRHNDAGNSGKVVINIGTRRTSLLEHENFNEDDDSKTSPEPEPNDIDNIDEDYDESTSALGSIHNDSMTRVGTHRPDRDHKIHYEKVCPMEMCKRIQVDSFVRSLPSYMRASPFTQFEQSFEDYEACSPEQLEILRQRIDRKKKKEKADLDQLDLDPLDEWKPSVDGTGVQTSNISMSMPECTCRGPNPSPTSSNGQIFNLEDLIPMKQVLNQINRECFFDNTVQFDRFKVIGHESSDTIRQQKLEQSKKESKLSEVTKVLKQHPSLLDIFQANTV